MYDPLYFILNLVFCLGMSVPMRHFWFYRYTLAKHILKQQYILSTSLSVIRNMNTIHGVFFEKKKKLRDTLDNKSK